MPRSRGLGDSWSVADPTPRAGRQCVEPIRPALLLGRSAQGPTEADTDADCDQKTAEGPFGDRLGRGLVAGAPGPSGRIIGFARAVDHAVAGRANRLDGLL